MAICQRRGCLCCLGSFLLFLLLRKLLEKEPLGGSIPHQSPEHLAWLTLFQQLPTLSDLPWTPTVVCEPVDSPLMERFDWIMMSQSTFDMKLGCFDILDTTPWVDRRRVPDPQSVWVAPHGLQRLLRAAEASFNVNRKDRMLLISGMEMPCSRAFGSSEEERNDTLTRLRRFFGRINCQTKDVEIEGVHLAPMGLSWGYFIYVLGNWSGWGTGSVSSYFIAAGAQGFRELLGNVTVEKKTKNILAAWGGIAGWLDDPAQCVDYLPFLEKIDGFLPKANSSLRAVEIAHQSRRQLRAWANTPTARAIGVERRSLGSLEFWVQVCQYRFILSPSGSGIQTAKNIEALLALTVPIVKRPEGLSTFDELVAMGFPMVLVERWSDVTKNSTERWWARLAPGLASFRRNCLSAEGWWRFYTGQVRRCE